MIASVAGAGLTKVEIRGDTDPGDIDRQAAPTSVMPIAGAADIPLMRKTALARTAITIAALALFCLLRPDILATVLGYPAEIRAGYRRHIASPRLIKSYIASHTVRKLQIGAGPNNYPGWLNTDIEPGDGQAFLDASAAFQIPDATFHYIYSEHVIEHITYEQGLGMLRECRRILAPGGKIRIATPNLLKFLALFEDRKPEEAARFIAGKLAWHGWPKTVADPACYILNSQLRWWGHQFVYSPAMLRASLESAGFTDVSQHQAGKSGDPVLAGLENRDKGKIAELNAYETMIFEAVRK
jgi:predicted SAM-dependent methyltransferase